MRAGREVPSEFSEPRTHAPIPELGEQITTRIGASPLLRAARRRDSPTAVRPERRQMRIHLITAESPESRRLRGWRLIQFPQLTMPLIAALTMREHEVYHTDEIVERLHFDRPADLVGITAPTPSALHAYELADAFRRRRVP